MHSVRGAGGLAPFYELHVWGRKPNPHGAFADMNPKVTCDHGAADHRSD